MEPSAGRASEMWPPGAGTDALASALAEQAADAAEKLLVQHYQGRGLYLTGRYSPGYGDWPLAVQPLLARLLDTPRQIGLCVQENCLMTPRKSITALLGVAEHPVQGHRAGCAHCVLRGRCEYRRGENAVKIHELFCQPQTLLLDGGFGTMLQAAGLRPGARPEELNLTEPDLVRSIHAAYAAAGSRVLNTNTFGVPPPSWRAAAIRWSRWCRLP